MGDDQARCVAPVRASLGEGPVWLAREDSIYFTDIKGCQLHRFELAIEKLSSWRVEQSISWLIPRKSGGFLCGAGDALVALALSDVGPHIERIAALELDRPGNRLNDAKADQWGRVWAGSMDNTEHRASGALYRIDNELRCDCIDDEYIVANGPTFSLDGKILFHTDSARRLVYAFDMLDDGAVSGKRVFTRFEESWGYPDGMCTDAEDCIWIAHWDGSRISRFDPTGALMRSIALPVSRPTSCVFAGKNLDRMFVTSASIGVDHEPNAGGLFEVYPGVVGAPTHECAA